MFDDYSITLKGMIQKLINKGGKTLDIPFKDLAKSFEELGERYNLGGGKTVELIKKTNKEMIIRCEMRKGDYYSPNMHSDADEVVNIVYGKLRNDNFRMTKGSMGQFSWKAGTPHELTAITDCMFYARFNKI